MSWLARHRRLAGGGEPAPGDRILSGLLRPVAGLYGLGIAIREVTLALGLRAVRRWPIPVLGVGALSAGGSGKTPLAAYLAGRLRDAGYRPFLVAHGYGAPEGRATARLLSGGSGGIREGWESAGEESVLLARLCPGVPIVIARSRQHAWAVMRDAGIPADVAVLDGGFQDLRLHQDLRLVALDASRSAGSGHLLPLGDLREPWGALRRADLLVLHRAELCANRVAWEGWLERRFPSRPRIWTRNRWGTPYALGRAGNVPGDQPIEWAALAGQRLGVWTGIGHPDSFLAGLARQGIRPVWRYLARDHAAFDAGTARELRRQARREQFEALIVTEKDAVKMEAWADQLPPVHVIPARIEIQSGVETLRALQERVLPPRTQSSRG